MTNIESLRLITEAVETAGADIAPSYAEYVQLAFAIATDCGEAGREFFHRLCRISAKYQREHAERMFSNALMKQHGEIHLGTAFHLAESTGVKICRGLPGGRGRPGGGRLQNGFRHLSPGADKPLPGPAGLLRPRPGTAHRKKGEGKDHILLCTGRRSASCIKRTIAKEVEIRYS